MEGSSLFHHRSVWPHRAPAAFGPAIPGSPWLPELTGQESDIFRGQTVSARLAMTAWANSIVLGEQGICARG